MAMAVPRWAISFADLGLVLMGCFVMLSAMEASRPRAEAGAPRPALTARLAETWQAADLFEPGEARLTETARADLRAAGSRWAGRRLRIVSHGAGEGSARLDRFELAAARSAAVARALHEGGVAERDVAVALEEAGGEGEGQTIALAPR